MSFVFNEEVTITISVSTGKRCEGFERLLSRLGIGAEDFHFLLGAKEYDKWYKRICILYAIKTKEYTEAKELLKSYSKQYSKEKSLDKQFVLDMNGIILRVEGGTDEDVIKCLTQAIKQTVNYSKKFDLKNHVLSIPELNIILDLENLKRSNSSVFLEILDYIENKGMDKKGLAKIFPKAAYLYSEAKKKEHITKDDFDCIIDTCNKAIEILRETESMYYLWELLKERELLYKMAPEYECWINDEESIKNSKWLATVECLYEENQVDKESMEHTLLYLSKGVECINDVIMKRRKMLGVSQTSLCHGVCNLRTLQRIEARDTTPTKYVMDQLFQRLGLAEQSKGFSIIIENPSAKELLETCKKLMNCGKYEEANEYFTRLKKETSIDYM